jgi:uncharacterized repeat protein (TIGR03803 family)
MNARITRTLFIGAIIALCATYASTEAHSIRPVQTPGFEPATSWIEHVVYAFGEPSGESCPLSGIAIAPSGTLYGTASGCGIGNQNGAVYSLERDGSRWVKHTLYSFKGSRDASYPQSGVTLGAAGKVYGVTPSGGDNDFCQDCGTVYVVQPQGGGYVERVLHRFLGGTDGKFPLGTLLRGADGSLYGTTIEGGGTRCLSGQGCGTVFKLTAGPNGFNETILYAFKGGHDGASPLGGVIADPHGVLYGATYEGGYTPCVSSCGTIFKLTPSGSGYSESIVYRFRGGGDGAYPFAGLVMGQAGAIYGTTMSFGKPYQRHYGTVFKLAPGGDRFTETTINRFKGGVDGESPRAGVIIGPNDVLYGTTIGGGDAAGDGTVFSLTPSGSSYYETILHRFSNDSDGSQPSCVLTFNAAGSIFGTTYEGGPGGFGTVFKMDPSAPLRRP